MRRPAPVPVILSPMHSPTASGALDVAARDAATVWHPYAAMPASHPAIEVVEAHGSRLVLADGRELIDAMSSWWAAIHGYRHPVLDQAARAQLDRMAHVMFGGLTHRPAVELAELLVEIAPPGLAHVFFADSGSVAVEVAIKMALQYWLGCGRPQRRRLLTVRGGYHGDTPGAMSVCDPETGMHHLFGDFLPRQLFAPRPSPRFDERWDESHLDRFDELMAQHTDEIAAVIIEPIVQGAGGMWFYSPAYLRGVRELCDSHGVLLIADEIATGFGRTGELFACDHSAISPDIMCVGKALTGGYLSLAAALCTAEVARGVSAGASGALMHGPTFMANPLAATIAKASVELLLSRPWRDEVRAIETGLQLGLGDLAGRAGVADVRVLGGIGVVEMTTPVSLAEVTRVAVDAGVWIRPFGRLVYTMPPYIASASDVAQICEAIGAVVDHVGGR
jgi:adenosylmethionine---8-amino-7-oxononanoate aminotransferase